VDNIKVVIMAGGKGTRAASIAADIPKPMIPIEGKPVLQYQIECLARNNLCDIILVTGHLSHVIEDYFGGGERFGVSLSYYKETAPLGTAGALTKIAGQLGSDFILLCGDILFDMNFARLLDFHFEKKADATLVSHPNSHPYDSALLITNAERRVVSWLSKEDPRRYYKNEVNAGIHVIKKSLLDMLPKESEKIDLDRELLRPALGARRVFAYTTPEYLKDMGTPDRYKEVIQDLHRDIPAKKNLSRPQRAIFLDRDGTINQIAGFVQRPEDFMLIEGAADAIKAINRSGCLAIVITNQPVIARGEVSLETLQMIHNKMETELGKEGAYLDDIYYCPHHPDKGYEGEVPEYKIECECRKPKPGMIREAAKKYNINIHESWMIGDSWRDVEAGYAAACKTAFLEGHEKTTLERLKKETAVYKSLLEFTADPRVLGVYA
jgi:D-glycero-D-manno-heptose 1,7-bisphosphate phosphatase